MTIEGQRIHAPGDCVDPLYGNPWCTGEAIWAENPFNAEIYGDYSPVFMCAGARAGSAADV